MGEHTVPHAGMRHILDSGIGAQRVDQTTSRVQVDSRNGIILSPAGFRNEELKEAQTGGGRYGRSPRVRPNQGGA